MADKVDLAHACGRGATAGVVNLVTRKPGDTLNLRQGPVLRQVLVKGLSMQRGPAPVAQALYEESADSLEKRLQAAEQRRLHSEPAQSIEHGRPTKRDRRNMDKSWDSRWSASLD